MLTITNNHAGHREIGDPHFATKAINVGQESERWNSDSILTSILFRKPLLSLGDDWNSPRRNLEKNLAALDDGKHAFCFASGTSAIDNVIHLLKPRDHIVCSNVVNGGTDRHFRHIASRQDIEFSLVDTTDLDVVRMSIRNNTKLIWIETPANPLMQLTDLAGIKKVLDESQKDILFVVDNSYMSPYFQRPLHFGADIVLEAVSKYINGHSDVVMGALVTNRDDLAEEFFSKQIAIGAIPSPIDCYMVQCGIRTVALRMQEHMKNGLAVARFLESHPCVEKVIHPGLPSHPQHQLALKQTSGSSGMLAFYIKGGLDESKKFLSAIKIFTFAESFGGCESMVGLPTMTSHSTTPREYLEKFGISDTFIRVSVGIESLEDILHDLDQALRIAVKTSDRKYSFTEIK